MTTTALVSSISLTDLMCVGSSIIYSEDDDDEDEQAFYQQNLKCWLYQCPGGGIVHDRIIHIDDSSQKLEVSIDVFCGFVECCECLTCVAIG